MEKKSNGNRRRLFLMFALPAAVIVLLLSWGIRRQTKDNPSDNKDGPETVIPDTGLQTTAAPEPGSTQPPPPQLEFPIALEGGALEVNSVFQYTGANPDCQWQEGEDIGAMVLVNRSERYLRSAELKAGLSNGECLRFLVSDIPPGQTVWVFEAGNGIYPVSESCVSVEGNAEFSDDAGVFPGKVTARAEGMTLTLTNTTEERLEKLTVRCHILFNEVYFGGITYSYPLESIPVGESAAVVAEDCIMGEAAAVWIGSAT